MKFVFVIILMMLSAASAYSQKTDNSPSLVQNDKMKLTSDIEFFKYSFLLQKHPKTTGRKLVLVPKNLVYSSYGYFCKRESIRLNSVKVPIKLRLGSLDYVDRLEYNR